MISVQDRLDTPVTFYTFNIPIKLFKNENEKWGSFAWHCFLTFFADKLTYQIIYSRNTMHNKKQITQYKITLFQKFAPS